MRGAKRVVDDSDDKSPPPVTPAQWVIARLLQTLSTFWLIHRGFLFVRMSLNIVLLYTSLNRKNIDFAEV